MKLQNGKHYDLVPDVMGQFAATSDKSLNAMQKALDDGIDAMEKTVRDMASQQGAVLK